MLKLKHFLASTFLKIHNVNKFYSKTIEKLEPVLTLAEALGAQKEKTAKPVIEAGVERLTSIDKTLTQISKAAQKGGAGGGADLSTKCGKKGDQSNPMKPQDPGPPRGYIVDKCGFYDIPKTNAKMWRNISFVVVPFAFGLSFFVLATKEEDPEPEYIPYEYMYKRTKRFPWGDGSKSLFHGPNNIIPAEEEERLDREAGTNAVRYKKRVNEEEEKKKRRAQHVQEELERRKKRQESE